MKNTLAKKSLVVKKSSIHGYGVFALENIQANEIIEECHLLQTANFDVTLENYYFSVKELSGIILGFGSIYNHSDTYNAEYFFDESKQLMIFTANRFIAKGEEIFISYGPDWFTGRQTIVKEISIFKKFIRHLGKPALKGLMVWVSIFLLIDLIRFLSALSLA